MSQEQPPFGLPGPVLAGIQRRPDPGLSLMLPTDADLWKARDQKTGTKLGNFNKDYANLTRRYYCNSINVCQLLTTSISPWDTSKQ